MYKTTFPVLFWFTSQGNAWKKYTLNIGANKNFEILIVAARGINWQGDIAIDDISFTDNCFVDLNRTCTPNEVCIFNASMGVGKKDRFL